MDRRLIQTLSLFAVAVVCLSGALMVLTPSDTDGALPADRQDVTYSITFDGDGGTSDYGEVHTFDVKGGSNTIHMPSATWTKKGYYLDHWESSSGRQYAPGDAFTPTKDETFTAVWVQFKADKIRIIDDLVVESGQPIKIYIDELATDLGGSIKLADCEYPEDWLSFFLGDSSDRSYFYGNAPSSGIYPMKLGKSIMGISPTTLCFNIIVKSSFDESATVSFWTDEVDESGAQKIKTVQAPVGTAITLPTIDDVPTSAIPEDSMLVAWNINDGSGNLPDYPLGSSYTVNGSYNAVAKWEANEHVLVFSLDGGSLSNVEAYIAASDSVYATPTADSVVETSGKTFIGWKDNEKSAIYEGNVLWAPGMEISPTEDHYFEAVYVNTGTSTHTVRFDANGGNGTLTQEVPSGYSVVLPQYGFDNTGYIFDGWSTSKDGSKPIATDTYSVSGDVTLYAVWKQAQNPVSSITISGPSTVYVGESITLTARTDGNADERGVRFTVSNTSGSVSISQSITSTGAECTVIGREPGTVTITATAIDGSGVSTSKTITVKEATVDLHTFTLSYDANGGSYAPSPDSVETEADVGYVAVTSELPIYEDHVFVGWNTEADGSGLTYAAGATVPITLPETSDTLYAQWAEEQGYHILNYDTNGAPTQIQSNSVPATGESWQFNITSEKPGWLGYIFLGWSDERTTPGQGTAEDVDYADGAPIVVSGEKTVYAVWADGMCTYQVKFELNGGSWNRADTETRTSTSNLYQFQLPYDMPNRPGYEFVGWKVGDNIIVDPGEEVFEPGDYITMEGAAGESVTITLTAWWGDGKAVHGLTFHDRAMEGATVTGMPANIESPTENKRSKFTIPEQVPTMVGADGVVYVFNGWSTDPEALSGGYHPGDVFYSAEDVDLYATWTLGGKYLTVTYWPGTTVSGITLPENQTVFLKQGEEKVSVTISDMEVERPGYKFLGWAYEDGKDNYDVMKGATFDISEDIDLYAVWRANTVQVEDHTVIFDSNGGSRVDSAIVKDGETVDRPADPTKEGFTFDGWLLNGVEYDFDSPVYGDIRLVANWIQEGGDEPVEPGTKVTISFDSNGGSEVQSIESAVQLTIELPDCSKEGQVFDGWYNGDDRVGGAGDTYTVTGDVTLTAHWKSENSDVGLYVMIAGIGLAVVFALIAVKLGVYYGIPAVVFASIAAVGALLYGGIL